MYERLVLHVVGLQHHHPSSRLSGLPEHVTAFPIPVCSPGLGSSSRGHAFGQLFNHVDRGFELGLVTKVDTKCR